MPNYRLHAARMDAEAGDDLVEHQRGAAGVAEGAKPLQELDRPQHGMAALHRLDQHGRDVADRWLRSSRGCTAGHRGSTVMLAMDPGGMPGARRQARCGPVPPQSP